MRLNEFKKKLMKNPEFAAEYEALGPQYELIAHIIRLRQMRGLTQAELADRLGTKQPAISRLEAGLDNPSVEFLSRVARALGARLILRLVPEERGTGIGKPSRVYIVPKPIPMPTITPPIKAPEFVPPERVPGRRKRL